MARLLFKRPNPGIRGVRGQIVTDIQTALGTAGHSVSIVDGVYGSETETAIKSFQAAHGLPATGQVDDVTYQRLMNQNAIPSLFHRCLQITAEYEGTGFTLVNGNFDGAGITWGIVGFTLSNGELSTMLREIDRQFPNVFSDSFGPLAAQMRQVLGPSRPQQMDFADSISIGNRSRIQPAWAEAFRELGSDQNVQEIQMKRVIQVYKNKADADAQALHLSEELSVALCFDISVQDGGLSPWEVTTIQQKTIGHSESQKRAVIAEVVANTAKPQFRKDVLDRKMTLATGIGTVHGDRYELATFGTNRASCPVGKPSCQPVPLNTDPRHRLLSSGGCHVRRFPARHDHRRPGSGARRSLCFPGSDDRRFPPSLHLP
jgi:Putative peptidoglycan binding domain/Glycosyl hydrolase family 46